MCCHSGYLVRRHQRRLPSEKRTASRSHTGSGVRPGVCLHSHSAGPVLVSVSLSALGNNSRGGSFSSGYPSFCLCFQRRLQTLGEPEVLRGSPDDRTRGSGRKLTRSPDSLPSPLGIFPWKGRRSLPQWRPLLPDQVSTPEGVVINYPAVCSSQVPAGPPMSSAGTSPR